MIYMISLSDASKELGPHYIVQRINVTAIPAVEI
jgi:hypothetical protein